MGTIFSEKPIKLFIGFILSDCSLLDTVYQEFEHLFGPTDTQSELFDFSHTDYYSKEMGAPLKKGFVSFSNLVLPSQLSSIKIQTNKIEDRYKINLLRKVNIDPGIISLHHVLLLSTKDFSHRIPLGKGIYAELTLLFSQGHFQTVPWTYPDFSRVDYQGYFLNVRDLFQSQRKEKDVS